MPFDKALRLVYLSACDFEEARDFIEAATKRDEASIEHR
jgi:hypothetical protein